MPQPPVKKPVDWKSIQRLIEKVIRHYHNGKRYIKTKTIVDYILDSDYKNHMQFKGLNPKGIRFRVSMALKLDLLKTGWTKWKSENRPASKTAGKGGWTVWVVPWVN